MAYTKYSLTPADNNAAPPNGAPEGMLPSAVNDTMRDMMAQIRDAGDGIRNGTYTMTAPVITGGSITGVALSGNTLTNPVITGGSINNTTVGATTRSTGAFTTLASNGATTFTAGTASTSTTTGTAVITGGLGVSGRINAANFDGIVGANTAAAGNFTTLGATGVATFSAGTVSAPAITTTGDTNTGIFFPAADTIAFTEGGVESMRITSAGRVGIGTSSPVSTLAVAGRITGLQSMATSGASGLAAYATGSGQGELAGASFWPTFVGTGDNGQRRAADIWSGFNGGNWGTQYLAFGVGNASNDGADVTPERMRITSAGELLVGTTAALGDTNAAIQIAAGTNASRYFSAGKGTGYGALFGYENGSGFGNGVMIRSVQTGDPIMFLTNNTNERMRIDASGNVGIGTGSPATAFYKLTVAGDAGNGAGIVIRSDSGTSNVFSRLAFTRDGTDGTTALIRNSNADYSLQFWTANGTSNTERMRITSDGNLLVGATSYVGGGANNSGVAIFNSSNTAGRINIGKTFSGNAAGIQFTHTGTEVGSITYSNTGVAYNTSSDYRLKENVAPMTGALARVSALKPVTYQWKVDGSAGEGFIAHELQAVVPDCVTGKKDAVDADGKPQYQGIDTSFLVATLTAALQEAHGLIKDLQARVETLEAK